MQGTASGPYIHSSQYGCRSASGRRSGGRPSDLDPGDQLLPREDRGADHSGVGTEFGLPDRRLPLGIESTAQEFGPRRLEDQLAGVHHAAAERRLVSVLFADLVGFTTASEGRDAEDTRELLSRYFETARTIIDRYGGTVEKFIGDAVMAVWGTPISSGNDTENSINAALLMRTELLDFNKDRGGPRKPVIKIGCGINSGPVLAGQIGSDDRM
jgi:class 3 adenylate cyclase